MSKERKKREPHCEEVLGSGKLAQQNETPGVITIYEIVLQELISVPFQCIVIATLQRKHRMAALQWGGLGGSHYKDRCQQELQWEMLQPVH